MVSFIAGRRTKWVVLLAWVLLVGGLAPLAAKFESAQRNEPSSFLPSGTESLAVLEAADGFPAGQSTTAAVVFFRQSGLTDGDRAFVDEIRSGLASEPPTGVGPVPPDPISSAVVSVASNVTTTGGCCTSNAPMSTCPN